MQRCGKVVLLDDGSHDPRRYIPTICAQQLDTAGVARQNYYRYTKTGSPGSFIAKDIRSLIFLFRRRQYRITDFKIPVKLRLLNQAIKLSTGFPRIRTLLRTNYRNNTMLTLFREKEIYTYM
jgi:hypothetical protein